jgi:hypothetical protein
VDNNNSVLRVMKANNLASKIYTVSIFWLKVKAKVKVVFALEQATKIQSRSRTIALLFL